MAISYPAVDGSPAVEESAVADPDSQSSAIAITKWAYRSIQKLKLSRGRKVP